MHQYILDYGLDTGIWMNAALFTAVLEDDHSPSQKTPSHL
jgi:hypothetical protein